MTRSSARARLAELAASLPAARVQNRLMGCADRDLALALDGMSTASAETLLTRLSDAKRQRVREELELAGRRRVSAIHKEMALLTVLEALEQDRPAAGCRSYLRPRRQSRG